MPLWFLQLCSAGCSLMSIPTGLFCLFAHQCNLWHIRTFLGGVFQKCHNHQGLSLSHTCMYKHQTPRINSTTVGHLILTKTGMLLAYYILHLVSICYITQPTWVFSWKFTPLSGSKGKDTFEKNEMNLHHLTLIWH